VSDHHKLAAAKSLQVRRKNRLLKELQRVPSLTRDQRAEVITAAASIPVEEYPGGAR